MKPFATFENRVDWPKERLVMEPSVPKRARFRVLLWVSNDAGERSQRELITKTPSSFSQLIGGPVAEAITAILHGDKTDEDFTPVENITAYGFQCFLWG